MLHIASEKPFIPRCQVKSLDFNLCWWTTVLQSSFVGRSIPKSLMLHDPAAYSDASSGIGIAIIISNKWQAWRLREGWQTLNGHKDIGWAEAVGFELLTLHIVGMGGTERNFRVYGDNQGVIEGWRNGRSRNKAVNLVFRRIFDLIYSSATPYSFHPAYVTSKCNPADAPSRGIYGSAEFLLLALPILNELQSFIIDPFIMSTNPADYSSSRIIMPVTKNIARNNSNESCGDNHRTGTDSLFFICQEQQLH